MILLTQNTSNTQEVTNAMKSAWLEMVSPSRVIAMAG